jgi:hypothetical protein
VDDGRAEAGRVAGPAGAAHFLHEHDGVLRHRLRAVSAAIDANRRAQPTAAITALASSITFVVSLAASFRMRRRTSHE